MENSRTLCMQDGKGWLSIFSFHQSGRVHCAAHILNSTVSNNEQRDQFYITMTMTSTHSSSVARSMMVTVTISCRETPPAYYSKCTVDSLFRVQWLQSEGDHSLPPSVMVTNKWRCDSTLPCAFMVSITTTLPVLFAQNKRPLLHNIIYSIANIKTALICVDFCVTGTNEILQGRLTFWRRNFFSNFSTPCI